MTSHISFDIRLVLWYLPSVTRKPRRVRHDPSTTPAPARVPVVRRLLRCIACGSTRTPAQFSESHAPVARLQTFGGYKSCSWSDAPLTAAERATMRLVLRAALDSLGTA